jgi:hypothetical protein
MIEITGQRQPGEGTATGNLAKQLPLILPGFPEIAAVHRGTINLRLDRPLLVLTPDHRTRPIDWDHANHPDGEIFDFLRIQFEAPVGSGPVDAWLYIAHNSQWRKDPRVHEVMAPMIENLDADAICKIRIDRPGWELPYQLWRAIVV